MKDYFPHDHHARADKKLVNLLRKQGMAGIGLYWCLVEMLYEESGWLKTADLENISYDLRVDIDQIKCLINDFDLFFITDNRFSSHSVLARLKMIEIKSSKAAKAAKTRWEKCKTDANALKSDANALQTHNPSNAGSNATRNALNENKEKESKEDTTPSTPAGAVAPNRHDAFLKEFNKITGRSFKTLDSKTKTQFDKLKKAGYQYSDFVTAITNGLEDSRTWQKPQLYTPEYITREANFSKYLNWKAIGTQSEYREPRAFNSIQEHYEYWGGSPAPKPEPSAA